MRLKRNIILNVALFLALPFVYGEIAPFRLSKCKIFPTSKSRTTYSNLHEPFTFLGEGTQSYVFLSHDKKTVLKLFKNVDGIEKTFEACKIANDIRDLTGVIDICLNGQIVPIVVKDEWGRKHCIDQAPFILQKRADPFFKTIRNAEKAQQTRLIESFYALLKEMGQQGIANLDDSLGRNYGFIDGKAVLIDFGKVVYAPSLIEQREAHMIQRLNKWLDKNHINQSVLPD